jgi:uncharacterized membrane-anchored protein YitT (DUF2179 family)
LSDKKKQHRKILRPIRVYTIRYLFIAFGAFLVAVGLEMFLVPNNIIDGGIIGLSIIFSHLSGQSLAFFIVVLNIPFMIIGYKQIGKTFAINTLIAVGFLALFSTLMHHYEALTDQLMLASIFGGIILGIGVGTIIRLGGALDGTEIIAILATKKMGFSVGEIVMFFNIFILGSAGFVFKWDAAMYSLITYYIAFKVIDIVIEGLDESKSVTIISDNYEEISEAIMDRLGRGVTHIYGKGGYTKEEKELLYCIVTRLEVAKLKSIVHEHDPKAFIAIEHVADVMGGRFNKKAIH